MLLTAEHISLNFGLKQLLDDVTLYLNEGDKIGIIGINGTGKSSFLRVLAGDQVPDEGKVSLDPNVQVSFLYWLFGFYSYEFVSNNRNNMEKAIPALLSFLTGSFRE